MSTVNKPLVGVVMGSSSDWDVMQHAVAILKEFGISHEAQVLSAHRMPDQMFDYAKAARERGLRAIIAGAGGAAHLPGMIASQTIVPVLGVPVPSKYSKAYRSRLSRLAKQVLPMQHWRPLRCWPLAIPHSPTNCCNSVLSKPRPPWP